MFLISLLFYNHLDNSDLYIALWFNSMSWELFYIQFRHFFLIIFCRANVHHKIIFLWRIHCWYIFLPLDVWDCFSNAFMFHVINNYFSWKWIIFSYYILKRVISSSFPLSRLTEYVLSFSLFSLMGSSLIAQLVKNPSAMQETPVRFLGWEDLLEKGQATHSSIPELPLWLSW